VPAVAERHALEADVRPGAAHAIVARTASHKKGDEDGDAREPLPRGQAQKRERRPGGPGVMVTVAHGVQI
jgi:hypothetical protein